MNFIHSGLYIKEGLKSIGIPEYFSTHFDCSEIKKNNNNEKIIIFNDPAIGGWFCLCARKLFQ